MIINGKTQIGEDSKRIYFLCLYIVAILLIIYASFSLFSTVFLSQYVYYKNNLGPDLVTALSQKTQYGNSLKAQNQLYCEHKLWKKDECYVVILVSSNPEILVSNKSSVEPLVFNFISKYNADMSKNKQVDFSVTEIKFTYKNQSLFNVNLNNINN